MWLLVWGFGNKSCKTGLEGLCQASGLGGGWVAFKSFLPIPSSTGTMSEREERRFVEIPRESVRLMAESTGLELSDEVAALLAEDVCYRLREATQVCSPPVPPTLLGNPLPQGSIHQTHRECTRCFEGIQWWPSCPSQSTPSSQPGFQQTKLFLGIFSCIPHNSPAGQAKQVHVYILRVRNRPREGP